MIIIGDATHNIRPASTPHIHDAFRTIQVWDRKVGNGEYTIGRAQEKVGAGEGDLGIRASQKVIGAFEEQIIEGGDPCAAQIQGGGSGQFNASSNVRYTATGGIFRKFG